MDVLHSLPELAAFSQPIHWAAGFFDGVHRGHQRVIASAAAKGALRGILTFEPHPLALLRPAVAPRLLTPDSAYKMSLFAKAGVDILLCLPFNASLAQMDGHDFLVELCQSCHVAGLSVGENWHFGKGGTGNARMLQQEAASLGFTACINPLVETEAGIISSSRIRALLAEGRMDVVQGMLGRPFAVVGTVVHGQQLARDLGFPTANIALPPQAALPRSGVYEVQARLGHVSCRGIANVGFRPTIHEAVKMPRLEAHFPGWDGDLYGKRLEVSLLRFLRPEQCFPSLEAMKAQIKADVASLEP